jgi:hypothetical protein
VQAKYPKYPIQHKGHPGQISGIFQYGNAEKHKHNEGHKTQAISDFSNPAGRAADRIDPSQPKKLSNQLTGNSL